MRCHGGKTKLGKQIATELIKIINNNERLDSYIEPFCGMCGVLYRFCQMCPKNIYISVTDKNDSIIKMWRAFQNGWTPENNFSKESFVEMKKLKTSSREKGYYGHAMTFGGLYFQCYQESLEKSLPLVSKKCSSMAQIMKNVNFVSGEYEIFTSMSNSLIFCDPPYSKYNRYYDEENRRIKFDTDLFWNWCLEMSKSNVVVVNEIYNEETVKKTGAYVTLMKTRKCKYSTNFNDDVECLYVIDNRNNLITNIKK